MINCQMFRNIRIEAVALSSIIQLVLVKIGHHAMLWQLINCLAMAIACQRKMAKLWTWKQEKYSGKNHIKYKSNQATRKWDSIQKLPATASSTDGWTAKFYKDYTLLLCSEIQIWIEQLSTSHYYPIFFQGGKEKQLHNRWLL